MRKFLTFISWLFSELNFWVFCKIKLWKNIKALNFIIFLFFQALNKIKSILTLIKKYLPEKSPPPISTVLACGWILIRSYINSECSIHGVLCYLFILMLSVFTIGTPTTSCKTSNCILQTKMNFIRSQTNFFCIHIRCFYQQIIAIRLVTIEIALFYIFLWVSRSLRQRN
jgi:hypothetical protein